jgi:hypothetical protein
MEGKMNSWFLKRVLAAAIALPALSGVAWAGGSDDFGCSERTLKGDYAFSVLTVAGATGPGVIVGLGTFDGKGGFTQIDYPGASGLADFRAGQTGTYTVNRDCTGFMTIDIVQAGVVVKNAIVISNGGRSIHAVVAALERGGTAAVPGQTRVDFWKVAPEDWND